MRGRERTCIKASNLFNFNFVTMATFLFTMEYY